ncbi:hypothetical protein ABIF14_000328 [Bradyrhizobium elkanii]
MPHVKLIARLLSVVELSEQDKVRLQQMPHIIKTFRDGDRVARQGDVPVHCAVVMTGMLSRRRVVSERNQIYRPSTYRGTYLISIRCICPFWITISAARGPRLWPSYPIRISGGC